MREGTRSETDAVERHRYHLQRSLEVLARGAWVYGRTERFRQWFIRAEGVEVRTASGAPLFLNASQNFEVRERPVLGGLVVAGHKAHTTGYIYGVGTVPDPNSALLEWHWHPPGLKYTHAHVHIQHEILGNVGKLHLPTARVWFEQIVAFLIVGFDVTPIDPGWRAVLSDVMQRVENASTWRGFRP